MVIKSKPSKQSLCLQRDVREIGLLIKLITYTGQVIAEHLINNCNFAFSYSDDLFTKLSKSHSDFHLNVLETFHILTYKSSLCKQRDCLLGLNLITI